MTDFTIISGRSTDYPPKHYGAHFNGNLATFCLEQDLLTFDANVKAIPNLPISSITTSPVTVGSKFFGGHIRYRLNDNQSECSFGTVRSHDLDGGKARWQYIQPTANTWDWVDLDAWVNTHYTAGRDILFQLFGTPPWASARPTEQNAYSDQSPEVIQYNRGIAAEPADMTKWDAFCTAVATRYKGKIKFYEVWNEANYYNDGTGPGRIDMYSTNVSATRSTYCFFTGTLTKLAEMTRRANQAIKAVDPTAKILCPNTTVWRATSGPTDTYFTGMMAASTGDGSTTMKDWIDIVAVHLYISGNNIIHLPGMIDRVKASMTTAGISGKEIWDTESAPISPDVIDMPLIEAKLFIARSMVIQAAKGIIRTFYFQYDESTMGIKNTSIVSYREQIRQLLLTGNIQSVCAFSDGRVGYYTSTGLNII